MNERNRLKSICIIKLNFQRKLSFCSYSARLKFSNLDLSGTSSFLHLKISIVRVLRINKIEVGNYDCISSDILLEYLI